MLHVQIKPELVSGLDRDEFLEFNPKNGQEFLDEVGLYSLGGLTLSLYGDETTPIYDPPTQRRVWDQPKRLDLSCGSPAAVTGMAFASSDEEYVRQNPTNPQGALALWNFFRRNGGLPEVAKILLPVNDVVFLDSSEARSLTYLPA